MFARFFVDRPVFATVLSIVIVIIGAVALQALPIAQYPEVVPPTVNVSATYPGASAKVVADTVAAPIEQEVNGVENMLYMLSKSTNDGQMNLDVSFLGARDYSMRIWLDPTALASRNMTAADVLNALREQNVQVAAGRIGQPPAPAGIDFQYTVNTLGRLLDPGQFADIVVKTGEQ